MKTGQDLPLLQLTRQTQHLPRGKQGTGKAKMQLLPSPTKSLSVQVSYHRVEHALRTEGAPFEMQAESQRIGCEVIVRDLEAELQVKIQNAPWTCVKLR